MDYAVLLLTLCVGMANCYSQSGNNFQNNMNCDDLSPYFGEIHLDQVAGTWYGVEKIYHNKGEYRIEHTQQCFYIDIKELYIEPTPPPPYGQDDMSLLNYNNPSYMMTTSPYVHRGFGLPERYRIRQFVLAWHEGIWKDEYHIKVNTSHKGFWVSDLPDRSVENMYRFFGGVIQVLKVHHNHMVLNFCLRLPHTQMFSVILARNENQLTPEDLVSIHNIFTLKHLSTSSLKRVCDSSATAATLSSFLLLISVLFMWRPSET